MGFSISWLAFAPGAPDPLRGFRLADTGRPATPGITPVSGSRLANGWYVVAFAGFGHAQVEPLNAESCSWGTRVVACTAGESVNTSSAALYEDGEQKWFAMHVLDEGRDHLALEGEPPAGAARHLATARRLAAKDGFDAVFSVPMILAHEACGFRHDTHHAAVFTELEAVPRVEMAVVAATLLPLARRVLEARGFECSTAGDRGATFVREEDGHRIECSIGLEPIESGGCYVNVPATVSNLRARRAIAAAWGEDEAAKPMFKGRFSEYTQLPYAVTTAAELADWTARAEPELGDWARALCDVKALDRWVNDGRERRNFLGGVYRAHYDWDTGHAPLALAHLARNPAFERMVAETAAEWGEEQRAKLEHFVRELRAIEP
jgi:hypothetical protein